MGSSLAILVWAASLPQLISLTDNTATQLYLPMIATEQKFKPRVQYEYHYNHDVIIYGHPATNHDNCVYHIHFNKFRESACIDVYICLSLFM
jgi:hypothetical protein